MKRTPALVPAAAALGLLAGLALEARAGTLHGEVSPHAVSVAWTVPGLPGVAGVELDEGGVLPPDGRALPRLAPMRARVPVRAQAERRVRRHVHEHHPAGKVMVRHGCPRRGGQAPQTHRS